MTNDIEKLIENVDIPEMEYASHNKHKSISYEVPEIVLPKTKAEVYEEAKDRLTRETIPVSAVYPRKRRGSSDKKQQKKSGAKPSKSSAAPAEVKTVELESAASVAFGSASIATRAIEKRNVDALKVLIEHKKPLETPKWVGSIEDLVPFAWRYPLIDVPKPSKYYKAAVRAATAPALPVPSDDE